jgi:hypothetical protein
LFNAEEINRSLTLGDNKSINSDWMDGLSNRRFNSSRTLCSLAEGGRGERDPIGHSFPKTKSVLDLYSFELKIDFAYILYARNFRRRVKDNEKGEYSWSK